MTVPTTAPIQKADGLPPTQRGFTNPILTVRRLCEADRARVLEFLAVRPLHTVFLRSHIHDNGMQSERNRGTFFGCFDAQGEVEGVALIGHATLVEVVSDAALKVFARLALGYPSAHLILGEQETVEEFCAHLASGGTTPRRVCRETFFARQAGSSWGFEPVVGLRQATVDDLEILLPVYAEMTREESGVNPLEVNPEGFWRRWQWRVEQGRVQVWIEGGRLIFAASVMCETADIIYLEGVYVAPEERGKGYGRRCLLQFCQALLEQADFVCLLSNEENQGGHKFFLSAGFEAVANYDSVFMRQPC